MSSCIKDMIASVIRFWSFLYTKEYMLGFVCVLVFDPLSISGTEADTIKTIFSLGKITCGHYRYSTLESNIKDYYYTLPIQVLLRAHL